MTSSIELIEFTTGGDPAAQPVASIVVLHGLGADGRDFVPVAQAMDLSIIGPVRFVFPSAPVRPVTINGGYEMRAWYDIFSFSTDPAAPRKEDEAGLRESQAIVLQLVEREVQRGVPAHRVVLMGFSQGCAMTLLAGLRAPQRLAGLVALSGYLPLAATTAAQASEANRGCQSSWRMAMPTTSWCWRAARRRATRWRLWATRCTGIPIPWGTRCVWTRSPTSTPGWCGASRLDLAQTGWFWRR